MAHLQRVMWFALGVLLAAVPMLATAADQTPGQKGLYRTATGAVGDNPSALCPSTRPHFVAYANLNAPFTGQPMSVESYNGGAGSTVSRHVGGCFYDPNNQTASNETKVYDRWYCLSGASRKSGNICEWPNSCPEGYVRDQVTGLCEHKPPEDCGEGWHMTTLGCRPDCEVGGNPSRRFSNNADTTCQAWCFWSRQAYIDKTGGSSACSESKWDANGQPKQWVCDMAKTGQNCEIDPDVDPEDSKPEKCAKGFVTSYVGGIKTCVRSPEVDKKEVKKEKEVKNEGTDDETTTEKTKETITKREGETIKTETKEITIIKDKDGETISETTTTNTGSESMTEFCDQNAGSAMCGDSGTWAGTCDQGFQCAGDAIECATARAVNEQNCMMQVSDDVMTFGDSMLAGDRPDGDPRNGDGEGDGDSEPIEIDDPSDYRIGGLVDESFTIFGKTVVLPFSRINPALDIMRIGMIMIGWLIAARILREVI